LIDLEFIFRLANFIVTIGLGLLLASMYSAKRTRFTSLYLWSVAFISYGLQIFLRIWYPWSSIEIFVLGIIMSFFLILGTSNLIRRNMIYVTVCVVGTAIGILSFPSDLWYKIGALGFFGTMTIATFHLRLSVGKWADRFVLGWLILLVSNVVFVAMLGVEWLADLFAIPAKGILALGMLDQRFTRMILDIKKLYSADRLAASRSEIK